MVLAQKEANVKGSRAGDFSSVRGGALQSQGFGGFLSSFKSQEQMLKHKKIEENQINKAKKIIAQQKYNDARNMTRKQMMINNESMLDGDDSDNSSQDNGRRPNHNARSSAQKR